MNSVMPLRRPCRSERGLESGLLTSNTSNNTALHYTTVECNAMGLTLINVKNTHIHQC